MIKYENPVCRGSFSLGTACGTCERCYEWLRKDREGNTKGVYENSNLEVEVFELPISETEMKIKYLIRISSPIQLSIDPNPVSITPYFSDLLTPEKALKQVILNRFKNVYLKVLSEDMEKMPCGAGKDLVKKCYNFTTKDVKIHYMDLVRKNGK